MKPLLQIVTEGRQSISQNSINGDELVKRIPLDLVFKIFSKLSVRSIARCRCVSKSWASILGLPDFRAVFDNIFCSPTAVVRLCKQGGFVFLRDTRQIKKKVSKIFNQITNGESLDGLGPPILTSLCNPSTGQSLTLPKVPKVKKVRRFMMISYVGYDPIERQFKVLSISLAVSGRPEMVCQKHKVLTLGSPKPSWREIECCIPYNPETSVICINGVIYYLALNLYSTVSMIVCFDVKDEKLSFVTVSKPFMITVRVRDGSMINYNGKLAFLWSEGRYNFFYGDSTSIKVCVLEDAENQEWSEQIYALPTSWQSVVGNKRLSFVGMTRRNEFVFTTHYVTYPFYVFCYNIERNTIVRVEVQGMEAFNNNTLLTVVDHVENVKLLQVS